MLRDSGRAVPQGKDSCVIRLKYRIPYTDGRSVCDIQMQYAAVGKENVAPYQYRPCWCIVLAEEDGKLQAYNQTTVFVDMQNGKICTYDMISGRLDDFKQYE